MARDNVGAVKCPITGEWAVVRQDCRGKLYFYSSAGKIAPNLPTGQRWLQANIKPLDGFKVTEMFAGAPPILSEIVPSYSSEKKRAAPKPSETAKAEPARVDTPPSVTGGDVSDQGAPKSGFLSQFGL